MEQCDSFVDCTVVTYVKLMRAFNTLKMFSHSDNENESKKSLNVHQLTNNPTLAWKEMQATQVVKKVKALPLDTPKKEGYVRFVCISDTHSKTKSLTVPPGDVLIHAGDFTNYGAYAEVRKFNNFLKTLPHPTKIVIAGNHELSFDETLNVSPHNDSNNPSKFLTNCTYLQDDFTITHSLKIYGSPWQPYHRGWAFNIQRGAKCMKQWKKIPTDTDILVTHSPPLGHGDLLENKNRAGCVELLHEVQTRIKPRFHIFGHIHEGYGITSNDVTTFINASVCNVHYEAKNPPIIFDYPVSVSEKQMSA